MAQDEQVNVAEEMLAAGWPLVNRRLCESGSDEALVSLYRAMQAVAQETKSTQVADAVERLAEHLSACTHADHAVLTTRLRYSLERCGLTLAAMPAVDEREKLREALEQIERAVGEARSQPGSNHTELLRQIYAVVRAALSNEPKP